MLCYLSCWLYWISSSLPQNWAVIQTALQDRKNVGDTAVSSSFGYLLHWNLFRPYLRHHDQTLAAELLNCIHGSTEMTLENGGKSRILGIFIAVGLQTNVEKTGKQCKNKEQY